MTDQNNAAQAVSEETRQAMAKALSDHMDRFSGDRFFRIDPFDDNEVNALLNAALSKLRAEGVQAGDEDTPPIAPDDEAVADAWITASDCDGIAYDGPSFERGYRAALASAPVPPAEVMDALNWLDDFVARCNGDDRGVCESVNLLRRALASAPVAGEAQPTDADITRTITTLMEQARYARHAVDGEMGVRVQDVMIARAVLARYGHTPLPVADAAPQASEAVCSCPTGDGSLRHPCAVHPPGHKDGGANTENGKEFSGFANSENAGSGDCAKVESLQRYGFGYADDGNGGRYLSSLKRDDGAFLRRDEVLAALSPTQPTEQGERDA